MQSTTKKHQAVLEVVTSEVEAWFICGTFWLDALGGFIEPIIFRVEFSIFCLSNQQLFGSFLLTFKRIFSESCINFIKAEPRSLSD